MTPVTHNPIEDLTPEVGTLLSLSEYKTLRKITSTDKGRDEQLEAALGIADDVIEQYTQRDFTSEPTTVTKRYRYEGTGVLDIHDCTNISKVKLYNRELTPDLDVIAGPSRGPIFEWLEFAWHGLLPAYSSGVMGFTSNRDTLHEFGIGGNLFYFVDVTAEFGWPRNKIPRSVKQAAAWFVDDYAVERPEAPGGSGRVSGESIADLSYSYAIEQASNVAPEVAPRIRALLDRFIRVEI